jgi:hypothetical protein
MILRAVLRATEKGSEVPSNLGTLDTAQRAVEIALRVGCPRVIS